MITGKRYAELAKDTRYNILTYNQCDCQGFVERVLYDAGVRDEKGNRLNWRGSNHMWRDALSWKGTVEECKAKFGEIPLGAWVFQLVFNGDEQKRGYYDDEGNAQHVGIYIGDNLCKDSTKIAGKRDGVGVRPLKDWNRIGLCKYIDYTETNKDNNYDRYISIIKDLYSLIGELERMVINDF